MRRCITTLVAFVWLFPTVCFQMYPQTVCPRGCKITLVATFLHCAILKCVLKWLAWGNVESHWLHLFEFSLPFVIGISLAVFLPKYLCSRFRSISRSSGSVRALLIFVSNWYVKRLHLIWVGRIEIESEFHQYFHSQNKFFNKRFGHFFVTDRQTLHHSIFISSPEKCKSTLSLLSSKRCYPLPGRCGDWQRSGVEPFERPGRSSTQAAWHGPAQVTLIVFS